MNDDDQGYRFPVNPRWKAAMEREQMARRSGKQPPEPGCGWALLRLIKDLVTYVLPIALILMLLYRDELEGVFALLRLIAIWLYAQIGG